MCAKQNWLRLFVILFLVTEITCTFEFTNLKCNCVDKEYCAVDHCYLKSVNRSYKYLSAKVTILQPPLTNAKINCALFKRFNGYKPFLYNFTVDACKFMKNRKGNPVVNYFFSLLGNSTNLNHSCPYQGTILVDKLPTSVINHHVTAILPFPEGDYLLEFHWFIDNLYRAVFKVYGTLS